MISKHSKLLAIEIGALGHSKFKTIISLFPYCEKYYARHLFDKAGKIACRLEGIGLTPTDKHNTLPKCEDFPYVQQVSALWPAMWGSSMIRYVCYVPQSVAKKLSGNAPAKV